MRRVSKPEISADPAVLSAVAKLLADSAGIDAHSLEAGRMQWLLERRCRHLHLQSASAYLDHLRASSHELEELIDALVIHETRFFRDPQVFEQIGAWAQRAAQKFAAPLRILSAPCSTGEEAYSLAAALESAGRPPASFAIDAFDISTAALATARRGIYPESAMRDAPAELRALCGELRAHSWRMREALRARIRFERRNLAEPGALGDAEKYHLILCRNLFIYLHPAARAALAQSLAAALAPGGCLVVGSADCVPELEALFTPLKPASSFAFALKPAADLSGAAEVSPPRRPRPQQTAKRSLAAATPPPRAQAASQPLADAAEFYRRAVEHHRHGNLRQAERRCRQALYLEPGYLPALQLLETLWQLHPNMRLRLALKARIRRAAADAGLLLTSPLWAESEGA